MFVCFSIFTVDQRNLNPVSIIAINFGKSVFLILIASSLQFPACVLTNKSFFVEYCHFISDLWTPKFPQMSNYYWNSSCTMKPFSSFQLCKLKNVCIRCNHLDKCYFISVEQRTLIIRRRNVKSWTLTDENVLDIILIPVLFPTKQPPTYLNQGANLGQCQFYCPVIVCGSANSYCCLCDTSLVPN